MPHPGACAPASRNDQWLLLSPWNAKVATGFVATAQLPPVNVDSCIFTNEGFEKSSKKMCGVPWLSMTMLENCAFFSEPLTNAGAVKGFPAPEIGRASCRERV